MLKLSRYIITQTNKILKKTSVKKSFFNNYDRFGNDAKHSVEIADAFISHFREQDVERAKYYIGESFLSFLNYDTVSVPKDVLKKLTLNVLTKKGSIVELLENAL